MHPLLTTDLVRLDTETRTTRPRWAGADVAELLRRGALARDAERLSRRAARLERRALALQARAERTRRLLGDVAGRAGTVRRSADLVHRLA